MIAPSGVLQRCLGRATAGLMACTVGAVMGATACRSSAPRDAADASAQVWLTTGDARAPLARQAPVPAAAATADSTVVTVTLAADSLRQVWLGAGAALSDAAVQLVQALPTARRDSLWHALFAPTETGLAVLRVPVGASDFSTQFYSYADTPGRATADLARDTLARFPLLRAARQLNPELAVLLAPWSAPAWMKTTNALIGGTLRADAESVYVDYLHSVVRGYTQHGVPVYALSLQNEPGFVPPDYPGMRLSAAQRARLIARLGPMLGAHTDTTRPRLLEWDHNWDHPEEPLAVLADVAARPYVSGVAWHCYAGDVVAQRTVRAAAPTVDAYFTECAGGAWAPNFADNLRWNAKTLLIGALAADARALVYWNLALDPQGGPHRGGCGNCRGVLTIDPVRGTVTPNVEYWILAHVSRFVRAGDRRIDAASTAPAVPVVAFRSARDQHRVVLLLNDSDRPRTIRLVDGARRYDVALPAGALATVTFPA